MKRIFVILIVILFMFPVYGQELFQSLVQKYSDVEGFSAVQLSKDMFDLYLKKKNIDEKDPVYAVVNNLENILVITQTKVEEKENPLKGIQSEILDYYKKNNLTLFKTEKTTESDLKIFVKKANEKVSSLGLVNLTSRTLTLIEINGGIDLASIASIGKAFNIRGLDALQRIDDSRIPFPSTGFAFQYDFPEVRNLGLSEQKQKEIQEEIKKAQEDMKAHKWEWTQQEKELKTMQKELQEKYRRFPILISGEMDDANYFINGKKVDKEEFSKLHPDQIEKIEVTKENKDNGKTKGQIKVTLKK